MQPPAKPPFSVRTAAMLLVVCTAALAELPVVPASLNATEYLFAEVDVDDEKLQAEVDFVGISVSVIDYGERNVDALAADVTEASSPASSSVSSSVSSSISSTMAATSTSRKPDTCQGNVWLARCSTIAVCLWRQRCEVSSDCSSHHDCGSDGFCQCKFVFKSGFQCYGNTLCAIKAFKKCDDDLLCAVTPTDDYLSTAMSLSLAFGACFIGMGAALLACKAWFRRWNVNPGGRAVRGDGDSESISSMQRWINERLRDRPPRYEDMNSVATFGDAGSARSAGISAVTGSAALAEEKPPSYETALSESEIASFYGQPVTSDCPPPPYAEDLGMSFSNPCFLEDVPHELGQPTPPSTGVTVSPTSSMTSLSTLASSTSASQRPSGLLTLSEVVALQEMVMAEEAVSNKVVRTDADRS